ncbi:hypothetical protein H8E88_15575 [candidate division KSB1 bacterium]|nr:hypothetical protein [candidate division KSB1 bacterium]
MQIQVKNDFNVNSLCTISRFELLRKGEKTKNAIDVEQKVKTQDSEDSNKANFLRCIKCKHPITKEADRIQINEKHQHVFANPQGHVFQIGCFARAPGCIVFGEKTSYFTWFPGYAWQTALCGLCGTLLGWAFQSKENHFFGLILDNLSK